MTSGILTILAIISTVFLPWSLTAIVTLVAAFFEPLVPLAIGLFADTLYFVPQSGSFPLFTLYGAIVTAISFLVRSQLSDSIINR